MQPLGGLQRPPRGDARRLGLPERQLKKTAPGDKPASRSTRWWFQVGVAPLLARAAEVGARSLSPPRAAGAPEQPLRRACGPPQARAGGRRGRQRVQQCGWRAWSAQDRGRRPRCGREVARRRDRLRAVFRCRRGPRGCDRWGAAAAPSRLLAGWGWPGGGSWSCQGRAEQRGRVRARRGRPITKLCTTMTVPVEGSRRSTLIMALVRSATSALLPLTSI